MPEPRDCANVRAPLAVHTTFKFIKRAYGLHLIQYGLSSPRYLPLTKIYMKQVAGISDVDGDSVSIRAHKTNTNTASEPPTPQETSG
jgi:hypothetical protein